MKNYLLYGDSEQNADLYYASQFLVPDPVFFLKSKNKSYLFLNDLEIDRAKSESAVDHVISLSEIVSKIKKQNSKLSPSVLDCILYFLKNKKIKHLIVAQTFPAYFAQKIISSKIKIEFASEPFWPQRGIKQKREVDAIKKALKCTSQAILHAYEILKASKIVGRYVMFEGKKLTSDFLRAQIDTHLLKNGCLAQHTIVASGQDAVDPHNRGSGPIYAHQALVMDVFPRHIASRYFADMTRTVVKGKASAILKKQWQTVKEAQEWAMQHIRAGANAKKIHLGIVERFEEKGFKTGLMNGRMQGFFHGTGHGLGLDIHEYPRFSKIDHHFKSGEVVTVEPGLYYQQSGGVRIEDVVLVQKDGCELLSKCPKILEID